MSEQVINFLKPIAVKYQQIRADDSYLNKVLDNGREYAINKSSKKIIQVKEAIGLGRKY